MPHLENLDDEKGAASDEDFESLEDHEDEIPDEVIRNTFKRKPVSAIHFTRPQSINLSNSERPKRGPGRPPGSGTKTKSRNVSTNVEQFWTGITSLALNFASAYLAAQIMHDKKYIMTKQEAESAGKALMLVAFKYKQFRDLAVIVNTDNDWAIIAKGFWPYTQRVIIGEIMNDVMAGLFVSRPKSGNGKGNKSTGNSSGNVNGYNGHAVEQRNTGIARQQFSPEIHGFNDWRDV